MIQSGYVLPPSLSPSLSPSLPPSLPPSIRIMYSVQEIFHKAVIEECKQEPVEPVIEMQCHDNNNNHCYVFSSSNARKLRQILPSFGKNKYKTDW